MEPLANAALGSERAQASAAASAAAATGARGTKGTKGYSKVPGNAAYAEGVPVAEPMER